MADNFGNQLRITDGSTSFEGGVDSAKWLLERTRPDDYGRNRVDVHTESKLTVNVIYDDD